MSAPAQPDMPGTTNNINEFDLSFLEKKCKDVKLDILLVVDGSGSVKKENFGRVKMLIRKLNERFHIGPNDSQIALMQFGSPTKTRIEFNLGDKNTLQEVNEGVEKMKYLKSGTSTGDALRKSREEVRIIVRLPLNIMHISSQ